MQAAHFAHHPVLTSASLDCRAACRSIQGTADEDSHAELDALLAAVLQANTDREKRLTEHVQQQQVDLQALHSAVERGTSDREQQLACLQLVQVCRTVIVQKASTVQRHCCSQP